MIILRFTSLRHVAVILTALLVAPTIGSASVGTVSSITVNEGEFTVHTRFSYSTDEDSKSLDTRFRQRLMTDYGLTDNLAVGIHFQGDNQGGDNQEYDATMAEARVELTDKKTHGYYSGFRLRYTHKDGDKTPSNAHIRLIAGVPVGKWDMRINQILAYEVGPDAKGGIGVDTRLQSTYYYHPDHRAGIESFSDFGYGSRTPKFDQQNHALGPVFAGKIDDGLFYEVGYRRGLSEAAADNTVKFFLTKNF